MRSSLVAFGALGSAVMLYCMISFVAPIQAALGQRFILTVPQTDDRSFLASWVEQTKPAGVMLLSYHVKSVEGAREVVSFLQTEAARCGIPPLIVAIDWEGGIVSRPNESGGFYSIPSPYMLAGAGPEACRKAGYCIGRQMYDIGVTMNFGPVLDLFGSRILSTRPLSADPETAVRCGIAFALGLKDALVEPVIKHFPGLGLGMVDTHYHAAAIEASDDTLARHMLPFKEAMSAGITNVMATHAAYAQFGQLPMTRNPAIPKLIKSFDAKALTITDDFFMAAAQDGISEEDGLAQSIKAGYDLIVYSANPAVVDSQITMLQALAVRQDLRGIGEAPAVTRFKARTSEGFIKSHESVHRMYSSVKDLSVELAAVCVPALRRDPMIERKVVEFITVDLSAIRTPPHGSCKKNHASQREVAPLAVLEPIESWFVTDGQSYLRQQLEAAGLIVDGEMVLDAKDESSIEVIRATVAWLCQKRNANRFIIVQTFFHGDGIWNKHQEAWLKELEPLSQRMLVVSLGCPTEGEVAPRCNVLNLGSFNRPLLDRAVELLTHRAGL